MTITGTTELEERKSWGLSEHIPYMQFYSDFIQQLSSECGKKRFVMTLKIAYLSAIMMTKFKKKKNLSG